MKIIGIIPSRYNSVRLPGKPLINILGKSMIQRVYEQCLKSNKLSDIIVATDNKRIYNHVLSFNGKAVMTAKTHESGTERCHEAVKNLEQNYDIVVNIQGDEPFIDPIQIDEVIQLFNNPNTEIGTLAKKIEDIELIKDENTPKAIFDNKGNAINFTRKIPIISKESTYYKHIGIYAYKTDVLEKICQLIPSKNELNEKLEQLRWLDNRYNITVGITKYESLSVDTTNDIKKIKEKMR